MVGCNLTDKQLQEIVDKTILYADKDGDGKISYEEFCDVSDYSPVLELDVDASPHYPTPLNTGGRQHGCSFKDGHRPERRELKHFR